MNTKEMIEKKKELGLSYGQIAEMSGVPLGTVQKVLGEITKNPRYETLMALEKALTVHESAMPQYTAAKQQGEYTIEDYYAIPDDRRVELIDGYIYDMTAPTSLHQILVTQIWKEFDKFIEKNNGNCVPLVSPIDVKFENDDRTMVQPDVIVVCNRGKLGARIDGAPDLVAEVLSPSSKKRDNVIKSKKYEEAGVKEYWIVDPKKRKVLVQDFAGGEWPEIYDFTDKIPVGIFEEECIIDFNKIYEYVKFMYE